MFQLSLSIILWQIFFFTLAQLQVQIYKSRILYIQNFEEKKSELWDVVYEKSQNCEM